MRNASFQKKLVLLCLALASVNLITGFIALSVLREIDADYHQITDINLPNTQNLGEMRVHMNAAVRNVIYLSKAGISPDDRKEYEDRLKGRFERYEKAKKSYLAIEFGPGEEKLYAAMDKEYQNLRTAFDRILPIAGSDQAADRALVTTLLNTDVEKSIDAFAKAAIELNAYHDRWAETARLAAERSAALGLKILLATVIGAIVFASFAGYFFSRSIANRLRQLTNRLLAGAEDLSSASSQISATTEQLSSSVTEQAASLQETSSAVAEINSMAQNNSGFAANSLSLSEECKQAAADGRTAASETRATMGEIDQANQLIATRVAESNAKLAEVIEVIQNMGAKTQVINDIVFQTKLLSFNASVEAARAGEAGKGFAVVAEEVGNLARMSGEAAREITELVNSSVQKVSALVDETRRQLENSMSVAQSRVETGRKISETSGRILDDLYQKVCSVHELSASISLGSNEQTQGVSEITKAISQVDLVTQQNASATQETASVASALMGQAQDLRQIVDELNQLVDGAGNARAIRDNVVQISSRSHVEKSRSAVGE